MSNSNWISRHVTHRGQRLHYQVAGAGPLVIFAHGGLSSGASFRDSGIADVFTDAYTVALPDSLGHGLSDKPADPLLYDLRQRAGDLVAVMDEIGADKAHVIGYSMGGWTASGMAMHFPDRTATLTVGGWDLENGMFTAARAFGFEAITFDVLIGIARQQAPALLEWVTPEVEPGLKASVDAINTLDGTADAVARLKAPVLLWLGREDPYYPPMRDYAKRNGFPVFAAPGDHVGVMAHAVDAGLAIRAFMEGRSFAEHEAHANASTLALEAFLAAETAKPKPQSSVRHAFASEPWFALLPSIVEGAVADATAANLLSGADSFSMCETYTSIPADVYATPTASWLWRLEGGKLAFERNAAENVDLNIVGDYDLLAPLAKAQFVGAPPPELMEPAMKAAAEGRFVMRRSGRPMPPALAILHNRVAAITA